MSLKFSIVGKGGTGKTTIASLLLDYLINHDRKPVLVVDADPNYNLNELLGVNVSLTLSDIRDSILKGKNPSFLSKQQYLQLKLNEALIEGQGFDLLVMGYPEDAGCYCPIHALLSQAFERLVNNYPYVIVDNEAGMEHIARLNFKEIDHLLIVSDGSLRGIETAGRIAELIYALKIKTERTWLLINKISESVFEEIKASLEKLCFKHNLEFLGYLTERHEIYRHDLERVPVFLWNSTIKAEIYRIFDKIWKN